MFCIGRFIYKKHAKIQAIRQANLKMTSSLLLKTLGESPKLRAINFFIENHIFDYSKAGVIKRICMSRNTLNEFWDELLKEAIIKETRKVGKSRMYTLNKETPLVKSLIEMNLRLVEEYAESLEEKVVAR
jgi:hypothetical protein